MSTPLVTPGFHHVTMVARSAPRTVAFYRDVLGLDLVKRTVNFDDPESRHLYFGQDGGRPGTLVTVFEWPDSPAGRWGVGGIHHLALGVDDLDGLLKWKRRLVDHGVRSSGPIDRGYFLSLYFTDPDGQVLEIATKGPGYALDEPADALGEREVTPDDTRLPGAPERGEFEGREHPEPVPVITNDMRLRGIHHVTGITGDLERAHDFYESALGLRIVKRTVNQDDGRTKHWFWAHYQGGEVGPHSALTLFGWPGSTYGARPGPGQTHHVAFRAKDDDELGAWQEHLRSLGVEVTEVRDRHYFRSLYFEAPDGLLLGIATDPPGFGVDEEPQALGNRLMLPPWLEERRETISRALPPLGEPRSLDDSAGVSAPEPSGAASPRRRPVSPGTERSSVTGHANGDDLMTGPDLEFEHVIPAGAEDGAPVAVLLHGRGADHRDLLGLHRGLPEGTVLVTPRAPFAAAPWGYGPGWAWYRYVGEDRVDGETLRQSLDALTRFLDGLPERLPIRPGPLVLGGFSQGGTMSLAHALRVAATGGTPPRVLNLSGFLVDDPLVDVEAGAPALRAFWGHGRRDPAIPWSLARKGRARLVAAGADLTVADHDGGHWVDPGVLSAAAIWMSGDPSGR